MRYAVSGVHVRRPSTLHEHLYRTRISVINRSAGYDRRLTRPEKRNARTSGNDTKPSRILPLPVYSNQTLRPVRVKRLLHLFERPY